MDACFDPVQLCVFLVHRATGKLLLCVDILQGTAAQGQTSILSPCSCAMPAVAVCCRCSRCWGWVVHSCAVPEDPQPRSSAGAAGSWPFWTAVFKPCCPAYRGKHGNVEVTRGRSEVRWPLASSAKYSVVCAPDSPGLKVHRALWQGKEQGSQHRAAESLLVCR